jgi:hypothetical protein
MLLFQCEGYVFGCSNMVDQGLNSPIGAIAVYDVCYVKCEVGVACGDDFESGGA